MKTFLVLIALVLGAGCAGSRPPSTFDDGRRDLVTRYYSQFQKPGYFVDDLMDFYAADVKFIDPTFGIAAAGTDEVRALYADLGTDRTQYRDIRWSIDEVVSQNDLTVIRGRWAGEFFGCPFDVDFVTLWRLRDGRIAEQTDFFAAGAFDEQVAWDAQARKASCHD